MADLHPTHDVRRFASHEAASAWLTNAGFKRIATYEWRHKKHNRLYAITNEDARAYRVTVVVNGMAPLEW